MRSIGKKSDLERKWHGIIDSLEGFFKERILHLRRKVDLNVPKGLKDADQSILNDAIALETKIIDDQIRMQINMSQEKLIESLNTKLYLKDSELLRVETSLQQTSKDFEHCKRKY